MTFAGTVFFLIASTALLLLPRRFAALPLLAGACYMTLAQRIDLGTIEFPIIRLLLLVGFIRVITHRELPAGGWCTLDKLLCAWAVWAVFSSAFHPDAGAVVENRLGIAYNTLGFYFLIRCFCSREEDVVVLVKMIAVVLVPLALAMLIEQRTQRNLFAVLGGVDEVSAIRDGRVRSQGPFGHPILAGTVGAVCMPLMIGIWRRHPASALLGVVAAFLVIVASASSGPLLSLMAGLFALILWRWRHLTRRMRIACLVGYLLLDLVIADPAYYYLLSRIDLTGSSTSWFRARLIQSAFEHLGEWWLVGTNFTRHWMPTGVSWSPDHTDITNHYIAQGVKGGLPLMLLFIACLWFGFRYVGQALRLRQDSSIQDQFLIWASGAALFSHAVTCFGIAYFDQSILFLCLSLAIIASLRTNAQRQKRTGKSKAHLDAASTPTSVEMSACIQT